MSYPPASRARQARIAVTTVFIAHGMVFSSWLPHIPLIKTDLGLSDGGLGLILLAPPAGALVAMSATGAACARWGSAAVTRALLIGYAIGVVAIGLSTATAWGMFIGLLVAGVMVGGLDVAMNAQAVAVEAAAEKSIMGSFHAIWSLAAAAGAAIGGIAAENGIALWLQLSVLSALVLIMAVPLGNRFITDPAARYQKQTRRWRVERGLVILAIVAFAALLAEGAVADWSAVFLSQNLAGSAFVSACGYGAFSVAMFIGRLAGDQLVRRFGSRNTIAVAGVAGGLGMAVALAISETRGAGAASQLILILGLCCLGLGIAVIVPVVFSTAGDGPGIATVSTGGYTGWLLGPAVIGGLGEWLGLPIAFWIVPLLAVLAGSMAPLGMAALSAPRLRSGTPRAK